MLHWLIKRLQTSNTYRMRVKYLRWINNYVVEVYSFTEVINFRNNFFTITFSLLFKRIGVAYVLVYFDNWPSQPLRSQSPYTIVVWIKRVSYYLYICSAKSQFEIHSKIKNSLLIRLQPVTFSRTFARFFLFFCAD